MAIYSRTFSLKDLLTDKRLRDVLPFISYKETMRDDGRVSVRTGGKTINRQVFDVAQAAAKPFYSPLIAHRNGDRMEIGGTLTGDHNDAVEAVYEAELAQKQMLSFIANYGDVFRDAMKESGKNKRVLGIDSKLLLRATSIEQIAGMSKPQRLALMNDILDNIVYGDDYPKTQKKYDFEHIPVKSGKSYAERQAAWKRRVGI